MDFEPIHPGPNLGNRIIFFMFFFFFLSFVTVQIQNYCLYSDSPSLLSRVMPRPPAPSAL